MVRTRTNDRRRLAWIAGAWLVAVALLAGTATAGPPCADPAGEAVSVQGTVEVRRSGASSWHPLAYKDTVCPGDAVRTLARSRADFALVNETILRIDQNTQVVFSAPVKESSTLVTVLSGAAYFISRTPRRFRVETPFVNAGVEGTEFLIRVDDGKTVVTVFEGKVAAENETGRVLLRNGQSATARAGEAPVLRVEARPRDAVRWALYYPPVLVPAPGAAAPEGAAADVRTRVSRAGELLSVGRVDEAGAEIDAVLAASPRNADALSLRSVIAVAQNDRDRALSFAQDAVAAEPRSVPALIALSYARQARFDLEGARAALATAVAVEPGNALARARLAEIDLSFGDLDAALAEARKAADADSALARAQTVLGFALLAREDTKRAAAAAESAIARDQADPLPRLCLGLARIRQGDLLSGRRDIEIASSLDPGNSLVRSYLGKAYFEEKRDAPAASQLAVAKELDSLDPTPHFYDAIRKQAANRPVEALRDLDRSIALNDSRAVYRSRLLLDEDMAARSASLGRIYEDLGFRQLALVEGWNSVAADPADGSAHRFLADSYAALPRHEIARVSELLQSQLLQPTAIAPVQPSLAESGLPIVAQSGPESPAFNEFNPLFLRDRVAFLGAGVAGEEETRGGEAVLSALRGPLSASVGYFRFKTDGFRENADQDRAVANAFLQGRLSYKTSVQAEYRKADTETGDVALRALGDFGPATRMGDNSKQVRIGLRHAFTPGSVVLLSLVSRRTEGEVRDPAPPSLILLPYEIRIEQKAEGGEAQYHLRTGRLHLVAGGGHFQIDFRQNVTAFPPAPLPPMTAPPLESTDEHSNGYVYALVRLAKAVTVTAGGSVDSLHSDLVSRDQFNPKVGLAVRLGPATTVRAAAFRTLRRPFVADQTLEPTQVAGFNQFFDEVDGARAWSYGFAVDRKFSADLFGGAELALRDVVTPYLEGFSGARKTADWRERTGRAYLYWTPETQVALGAEYLEERFYRDTGSQIEFDHVTTRRVPLSASWFHPLGFFARAKATWFDQEGEFYPMIFLTGEPPVPAENSFWVVDASLGYRLPRRLGLVAVEGRNLFNRTFRFQETDPAHPSVLPGRAVVVKATLSL